MYHELEIPGRLSCQSEEGYLRYVVRQNDFRSQLLWLKENNILGINVTTALRAAHSEQAAVAITFDDGCETDLLAGAPLLKELGFDATFYVVGEWVGGPGYLSAPQLRQLSGLGFEIGCHSMTHPYLTDLNATQLNTEITQAKDRLEQLIGKNVDHFSCPNGRWSQAVAEVARQAGYFSVATSSIGINSRMTDPFRLARSAVMRNHSLADFRRVVAGRNLLWRQSRESFLWAAKKLLGNSAYAKLRSSILGRG